MQYLVEMKLADSVRSKSPTDGIVLIERYIVPTLEMCKNLQAEGRIIAGGPASGAIHLILIVTADSAAELDAIVAGLPVWPLMETTVTPMTTFEGRLQALRPRLESLKLAEAATAQRSELGPDLRFRINSEPTESA